MVSELPPNHLDVAREVLRETDEPPASGWLPSVSGSRRRNQSLKRFSAPPRDRATESSDILPTTTCASRVSQLRPHASPGPGRSTSPRDARPTYAGQAEKTRKQDSRDRSCLLL